MLLILVVVSLSVSVFLSVYSPKNLAEELRDCLPKSDTASHEKCQQLLNTIKNFDECVEAGFSILKSNPPQCLLPDGRNFYEYR